MPRCWHRGILIPVLCLAVVVVMPVSAVPTVTPAPPVVPPITPVMVTHLILVVPIAIAATAIVILSHCQAAKAKNQ